MDIHRCRFVDYFPSSIHSLAFSHSSPYNPRSSSLPASLRMAIGRSNGSIEIWHPTTWFHESTLQGGQNRSIEGLAWVRQSHYSIRNTDLLRLFSIGNSTVITEWDLVTGKPLAHFDCGKGVIWSIAAQPKKSWFNDRTRSKGRNDKTEETDYIDDGTDGMQLVVGCEDGSLVVVSVEGGPGDMQLVKIIPQSKPCRVLSLAYQTPDIIVAGTSDSRIRAFDLKVGRLLSTMTIGPKFNSRKAHAKKRDTHVWTVKCIPGNGGWIVAGDSLGEISLWDGKRYTLRQKIKAHDADILTLETNANGTQIFSSGVDRLTVKYELVGSGKRATWTEVAKRRFHKHDVRTMAGFEAGNYSVLVSGGVDMTPIVTPLRAFGQEFHYTVSALPQHQVCTTSPKSRLLIAQFDREVKFWRINSIDEVEAADDVELYGSIDEDQGRKLVGRIVVNTEENISSAAISPNGNLIAISTMATIKLFHLRPRKSTQSLLLRISKLEIPEKVAAFGARKVLFSPDEKYLIFIAPNSDPYILKINSDVDEEGKTKFEFGSLQHLERKDREPAPTPKLHRKDGVIAFGRGYERQINQAIFSPDGKYLFAADIGGWMECWSCEKKEWKLQKSSLPRLPAPAVAVGFRPPAIEDKGKTNKVFVLTSDHTLHEFDVTTGNLTEWSNRNSGKLPKQFLAVKDRACGMNLVDEGVKGRRMWIWGHGWIFMINVDGELPVPRQKKRLEEGNKEESIGLKRKRGLVMTSGAGGKALEGDSGAVKETIVVRKKAEEEEDITEDVDSEDEFLVDVSKSERATKSREVEVVESESESENDSDGSEEEKDDEDSSSEDSKSGSDSDADSDEQVSSDSGVSVPEEPDKEVDKMDLDTPASAAVVPVGRTVEGATHWMSFQYRNVLGLLPIGDPKEDLEMVVVERPVNHFKLPPAWMPKKEMVRVQTF